MNLNSPFGVVEVHFYDDRSGVISSSRANGIVINRVHLQFRKEFAIIDQFWALVQCSDSGKHYYRNSSPNLRYYDWQHSQSCPSYAACEKLVAFLNEFVAQLNRGAYNRQLLEANVAQLKNQLTNIDSRISAAHEQIQQMQAEKENLKNLLSLANMQVYACTLAKN